MDILAMSPAQVVVALIKKTLGDVGLEEQYVTMTFKEDTSVASDSRVKVTLNGRDKTSTGEPGKWSGTTALTVRRALLRKAGTQIALRVPFVDGMSVDGLLRALLTYHSFQVTQEELVFALSANVGYGPLPASYSPVPGTLYCKFSDDNLRFDPDGSEFRIELYRDARPALNKALARSALTNVSAAVEE